MRFEKLLILALWLLAPLAAKALTPVTVQALSEVLVDLDRRAPADVRPLNDAVMAAEVAAVVSTVHADVGQTVAAGELLLQLDDTDYLLNLKQAEANLASSKARKAEADAKLSRAMELGQNQYVSADELQERETSVMVAAARIQVDEVAVSMARRNLEKCSVTAPFAGVVAKRMAHVGSYVINGNPLLQLTQTDKFELDAEIPANIADSLDSADSMYFLSRGEQWPVELLRLSPSIENQRRSRRARFAFTGTAPSVGRSGELVWKVEKGLLPSNLVVRRDDVMGVFLHDSGSAVFTPLPGAQEGRPVVVDLPLNSEIVIRGRDRLQDGDAVSVSR